MYIQLSETFSTNFRFCRGFHPNESHVTFFQVFWTRGLGIPNASATLFPKHGLANQGQSSPYRVFQTAVREERRPDPVFRPGFASGPLKRFFWQQTEPNTIFWGAGRGVKWSFLPSGQLNVIKRLVGICAMEENGPKGLFVPAWRWNARWPRHSTASPIYTVPGVV